MKYLFLEYPKCSTCQNARRWLEDHKIDFTARHIVENNPTAAELKEWHRRSGLPLNKFINTSGLLYKSMELKNKLPAMSEDEIYALLATNGMLVKRPLVIGSEAILTGFKPQDWEAKLL